MPLAILVLVLIASLCLGFALPLGLMAGGSDSGRIILSFVRSTPLGLLLGLALLGIIYLVAYLWSDTLIFTQAEIRRNSIPLPLLDSRSVRYDQITGIRNTMRGLLLIETSGANVMLIRVGGYEGGPTKLVDELQQRLGERRFTPQIQDQIWQRTKADRWNIGLSIVALLFFLSAAGWSYFQERGRAGIGWNIGAKAGLAADIVDFTFGKDGSLWLLERKGFPIGQGESYQVIQTRDGEGALYEIPEMADLLPSDSNQYTYPSQVLIDNEGAPWLNFRFLDQILQLKGDQREWLKIPRTVIQGYIQDFVVSNGAFWGEHYNQLVVVEPDEFAVWRVPGFSVESAPELELFETPTGGLVLAYFSSGKSVMSPLAFESGNLGWVEILTKNEKMALERESTLATTNTWGMPFVLTWGGSRCSEGEILLNIGRHTSVEHGWAWSELGVSHDCDTPFEADGFVVDVQGRMWIATPDGVRVYRGLTFQEKGAEKAIEIAHYTESNSGYSPGLLRQDIRGRIWSLGERGKFLVWQDGGIEILPMALPESIAALLGSQWIPLILQYLGIFAIVGIFLVVWKTNRFKGGTR